jgi:hypothetical protein
MVALSHKLRITLLHQAAHFGTRASNPFAASEGAGRGKGRPEILCGWGGI